MHIICLIIPYNKRSCQDGFRNVYMTNIMKVLILELSHCFEVFLVIDACLGAVQYLSNMLNVRTKTARGKPRAVII